MKITFIYPDIGSWGAHYYNFGIGYLSAVLRKAGHKTSLLHYIKPVSEQELVKSIDKEAPDLLAFSSNTHMFRYVKQWAQWIKRHFDIPMIYGGVHPTIDPEGAINVEGIDMICVGEGEEAMEELCRKYENGEDITNISSLWIKKDNALIRNPVRPLIEDLDTLPFPDRKIFDYRRLHYLLNYTANVAASRGCPYNCSFCCNHAIRSIYPNKEKYVRYRSVDNVIEEISQIIAEYPFIRFIKFEDDILPLNKSWFKEFAGKYKTEIHQPFSCNCRADLLDEETVQLLKAAGCYRVRFGVETGNDYLRKEILHRHMTQEQIINAFELCQKRGIQTVANDMIGLPFENMQTILETIKLNARIRPHLIRAFIFYPYPKTDLYNICKKNNFLTQRKFNTFMEGSVLAQNGITQTEISFAFETFPYFVRFYSFCNRLPRSFNACITEFLNSFFYSKGTLRDLLRLALELKRKVEFKRNAFLKQRLVPVFRFLQGIRLKLARGKDYHWE